MNNYTKINEILHFSDVHPVDCRFILSYISELEKENEKLKDRDLIFAIELDKLQQENEKLNHYKLLYQKVKERNDKGIEYIESKNNGMCIVNGEEKGAYTFLLDFDKSRELVWSLLEILKGENND